MPSKDIDVRRETNRRAMARYYAAHPGRQAAANLARKRKLIAELAAYKVAQGCATCGMRHPACLDFHHQDPSSKGTNISTLVQMCSKKQLQVELTKCIVLCANCHRIHHYEERLKSNEAAEADSTLEAS